MSSSFIRIFFLIINIFVMTSCFISFGGGMTSLHFLFGIASGLGLSGFLFLIEKAVQKYHLRSLNICLLGLFVGYLLSRGTLLIFDTLLDVTSLSMHSSPQVIEVMKSCLFLFATYLGVVMTARSANQLHLSIPFFKLSPNASEKKELIIDASALADPRIIDLANSGLIDNQLVVPRFLLKEIDHQSLETIKQLEQMPHLNLRLETTDFPHIYDINKRIIRLTTFLGGNLLTADIGRIAPEEIRIINLHHLANALKPITQTGEIIKIKIQRYGKEENQGIGYLEDGTMVVVNGGGEYIGEIIETQVLSVKHSNSGHFRRMIFCNVNEEPFDEELEEELIHEHT